jgi:cytochrome P450
MQPEVQTPVEPIARQDNNWVVSGFEEAAMVLRGGPGWSSNPENAQSASAETAEPPLVAANMVWKDPPEHTRLRRQLGPAFTPRAIERLRPRVISIVEGVLDALEEQDEADLAADVGLVVALSFMSELLDVGFEGADLFLEQTPRLLRFSEVRPTAQDREIVAEAVTELTGFMLPIIEERRRDPGEDFLSTLATSEGMSNDDIMATCTLMLTAGGMATGALIANSALALLQNPEQIPALLANPAQAADELARMEGTSKHLIRISVGDHDICGHHITKGEAVLVNVPAANRDLRRAPDADQMDLSREPLPHLTFGNGPHYCLGAPIAQLELAETLVRLFTRFPNMSLAGEPVWLASTTFRWLQELPVRLR